MRMEFSGRDLSQALPREPTPPTQEQSPLGAGTELECPSSSKAQAEISKKHFSISLVTCRYIQLARVRVTVRGGHGVKHKKARSNILPQSHYN